MSEVDVSVPQGEVLAKGVEGSLTAGRMLRSAREAAGLHIAALAVSMKVPVKKLEALEADRADLLPDAVFVRALASSVCRTLKIDSAPILALLPQTAKQSLDSRGRGINAPFRVQGEARSLGFFDAIKRPSVVVVTLLLLAAVAVVFMPEFPAADVTPPAMAVTAPDPAVSPVSGDASAIEKTDEKVVPVEVVPGPVPAEAPKPPVSEPVAPAVVTAPVISAVSSAPMPKPNDMVVLRAKGTTWVEVIDATGAVLVRRTLQADGVTAATGVAPLAVVVGKADVVEVEVRGKPFGLTGVSKDNVARFEVK